jgi:hypothetical protein
VVLGSSIRSERSVGNKGQDINDEAFETLNATMGVWHRVAMDSVQHR